MHFRSRKKVRAECSIYEPLGTDKEGNEISFIDVLGTDSEVVPDLVCTQFEQERLWKKLKKLSTQERRVLIMRFGLIDGFKYTQREIAKKLGISRSYVSRIEKKAISRLTEQFSLEATSFN